MSIYDPAKALDQMETAYTTLLQHPTRNGTNPDSKDHTSVLAKDGHAHLRLVTLGGDHTIVLPILQSLNQAYRPVSVSDLRTFQFSCFQIKSDSTLKGHSL